MIHKDIHFYRSKLTPILQQLVGLTDKIDQDEMNDTAQDILVAVNDPFMFVIVGEVKAGKSSFINALLNTGEEICKVAPSPMTDKIQQIVYGEDEATYQINDHINRISKKIDILKDIAIVDTPGTNTIIDHHQEVTESFIPSSDLIVFVFEAKNPYRQSAWDFFDYINKEWHKKIIFVLQQKDLLPPDDLKINSDGVRQYAIQKGITAPQVFEVSALDELQGRNESSGFSQLRNYIQENITGKKAALQKLHNLSKTAQALTQKIDNGIQLRARQLEYDQKFRKDIQLSLEHQEEKSNRYSNMLSENIIACYQQIMNDKKSELKENIGFFQLVRRSLGSMFSNDKNLKSWLEEFSKSIESQLNKEFTKRLDDGIGDISDSIQNMAKLVDQKIRNSETILKDDHEIFADIAEKRSYVIKDLNDTFKSFLENSESFYPEKIDHKTKALIPDMAKGSGLAVVGMIITGITNAAVFDITGGIITAIGLSFAGITLGFNKRSILKSYDEAVLSGKEKIATQLNERLEQYAFKIKQKIEDNFRKFDLHLDQETSNVEILKDEMNHISSSLIEFQSTIQKAI